MSAASELCGQIVIGERQAKEWRVLDQITFERGVSAGHNSYGYRVERKDGLPAFLKATDLRLASMGDPKFLEQLKLRVDAHTIERKLLDRANEKNLDKVVTVIDYGALDISHEGSVYSVLFLIFELADGDIRKRIRHNELISIIELITIAHNIANAVSQLHKAEIRHNDIKPGNCLFFDADLQKLADLGQATAPFIESHLDSFLRVGDPQYAPPEQLYAIGPEELELNFDKLRRLGDIYGFGSVLHFLLTGRMITPEIYVRLGQDVRPARHGGNWTTGYYEALPFVRNAWAAVFSRARDDAPLDALKKIRSELISIAEAASDPDPRRRGRMVEGRQTLSLEYFMSRLDALRRQAAVISRA